MNRNTGILTLLIISVGNSQPKEHHAQALIDYMQVNDRA
jgi:hypothetical protein